MGQFYSLLPMGRSSALAVQGWHYYVVENDDPVVVVHDTTGAIVRELRVEVSAEARRVTPSDIDNIRDRYNARYPPELDVREIIDRMPIPSIGPHFGWQGERPLTMLRVAEDGGLWVLEFGGLRNTQPVWIALNPDGSLGSRFTAEEELDVLYLDSQIAIVRRWGRFDVELVESRRIP